MTAPRGIPKMTQSAPPVFHKFDGSLWEADFTEIRWPFQEHFWLRVLRWTFGGILPQSSRILSTQSETAAVSLNDVCRRVFGIPRDLNDVGGSVNDVCRRVFGIPRGLNDVGGGRNDVCRRVFGIPSAAVIEDFVYPK